MDAFIALPPSLPELVTYKLHGNPQLMGYPPK